MAAKVNIDYVSQSLSELLQKADEFNIKKQSLTANIAEIQKAIPLFERLISLYESIPDANSPRAKNYLRIAQQIASRNDGGWQGARDDLASEARLADRENAKNRLSDSEAEQVGKYIRSSKLADFVMEFDVENLDRFKKFKELIAAITDEGAGLSRKDAQTRRVANIRDILREYTAGSKKQYPANDPYGTMADGDTLFGPNDAMPAGTPPDSLGDKVGGLYYSGGKWYRLDSISANNGGTHKSWSRVSETAARKELGPSAYAAERRRGELETQAVASIEKSSRYIADLEPAGSKSKEKKDKPPGAIKRAAQNYWDAFLQLAKWAGWGVATLGAIAGAAALIPKIFNRINKWRETNENAKAGHEKFGDDARSITADGVNDMGQAAKEYDEQVSRWSKMYSDFSYDNIQGDVVGTYLAGNEDVYGHDTLRRGLSLNGLTRNSQFKADILRAYGKYKETGEATFYSTANKDGSTQLYHLAMFEGELPGLTEENKAGLRRDYAQFAVQQGLVHLNARPGWGQLGRTVAQQGLGIAGGVLGFYSPIPGGTLIGYGAGVGAGVYAESARSDFKDGMSLKDYQKLSPQEQAVMALRRFQQGDNRGEINYALNFGYLPTIEQTAALTGTGGDRVLPREMLGELVVTPGWVEKHAPSFVGKQLQRVRAAHAQHALGVIDLNTRKDIIYDAASKIVQFWESKAPSEKWKEQNFDKIPSATSLAEELNRITDFTKYGDVKDNIDANLGGRPNYYTPNVITQNYVTQTNVVPDDNIQTQVGKQ